MAGSKLRAERTETRLLRRMTEARGNLLVLRDGLVEMRFLLPKTEARLFLGLRDGLDGLAETRLLLRESEMRLFWGFVMD